MEYIFTNLLPYFVVGYFCAAVTLTLVRYRGESAHKRNLAFVRHAFVLAALCFLVTLYDVFSVADYTTVDKVFSTAGSIFLIFGATTLLKERRRK